MRDKLVVGNWKLQGSHQMITPFCEALLQAFPKPGNVQMAVCPPYPYLAVFQRFLNGSAIAWGAQNLATEAKGAYTGEVAAEMLLDFGCRYVIIGHSERRALYFEQNQDLLLKLNQALGVDLTPIFCVGESQEQREAGQTFKIIEQQLEVIAQLPDNLADKVVIAYEPVWAIGTGLTATPDQAQEVHQWIRSDLAKKGVNSDQTLILYGGSVKPSNAKDLMSMKDIDGALVGGASLKANDFIEIGKAC